MLVHHVRKLFNKCHQGKLKQEQERSDITRLTVRLLPSLCAAVIVAALRMAVQDIRIISIKFLLEQFLPKQPETRTR